MLLSRRWGPGLVIAFCTMASPAGAAGPSFPCTGSLSGTEDIICHDSGLAQLDLDLAIAYDRTLESAAARERDAVRVEQKEWIATRDGCGRERSCIRRAYTDRLAALGKSASVQPRPSGDDDADEPVSTTALGHNGSTMQMRTGAGNRVVIRYGSVRPGMPVEEGAVLFRGTTDSGRLRGTAYLFKRGCQPVGYEVSGQQTHDRIVLRGAAPVHEAAGCGVIGHDETSPNARLEFTIAE